MYEEAIYAVFDGYWSIFIGAMGLELLVLLLAMPVIFAVYFLKKEAA